MLDGLRGKEDFDFHELEDLINQISNQACHTPTKHLLKLASQLSDAKLPATPINVDPQDGFSFDSTDRYNYAATRDPAVVRRELIAGIEALEAVAFLGNNRSVWALPWPNLVYLLQTYSMMMSLVMGVAIFIGVMMQMFLYVMTNLDPVPEHAHMRSSRLHLVCLVICLPVLLFLGCLCIFNSICLLAGQAANVSFARCRAIMFAAYLCQRKSWRNHVTNACWYVDFWFSTGFGWLLVAFAVAGAWKSSFEELSFGKCYRLFTALWGWPMIGACFWGVATMFLHIVCDLLTGNDSNEDIRNTILGVHMILSKYDLRPGKMSLHTQLLSSVVVLQEDGADRHMRSTSSIRETWHKKYSWLVSPVMLFLLALAMYEAYDPRVIFLTKYSTVLLISAWILFALLSLAWYSTHKFPKIFRCTFVISVVLMAFVTDAILCAGLHLVPYFHGEPVAVPLEHGHDPWVYPNATTAGHIRHQQPTYPACHLRWGGPEEMQVLDLAILSAYSYDPDNISYQEGGKVWVSMSKSFTGKGIVAQILLAQDYWQVGRVVVFRLAAQGASAGTTVLVVKGSSQAYDFYADAGMWAAIASFQVFMPLIPLLDQLPNWVFARILLQSRGFTGTEEQVFGNIHEIYSRLRRDPRYMNDTFMITGHSLGGGIATAAGGSLGIPAVSFSGPGSHFSRWRFGTTVEKAYRSALTVKPEIDVVHKIDRHDDMSQYIDCRDRDGNYRDFATCHSIGTTTCELWRVCGDQRGRDFKAMCKSLLGDESHVGAYLGRVSE